MKSNLRKNVLPQLSRYNMFPSNDVIEDSGGTARQEKPVMYKLEKNLKMMYLN